MLGKRINEYRNEYTIPDDMSWPNILSHGADHSDRTDYGMYCGADFKLVWDYPSGYTDVIIDPSLDWEETIPWLRKNTSLKIWLKGGMFVLLRELSKEARGFADN